MEVVIGGVTSKGYESEYAPGEFIATVTIMRLNQPEKSPSHDRYHVAFSAQQKQPDKGREMIPDCILNRVSVFCGYGNWLSEFMVLLVDSFVEGSPVHESV